jgi:hypothetical protein
MPDILGLHHVQLRVILKRIWIFTQAYLARGW